VDLPAALTLYPDGARAPSAATRAAERAAEGWGALDAIYTVGLASCAQRASIMEAVGTHVGLPLTRIEATPFSAVDLAAPPLPVVNVPAGDSVAAGQVGCSHTHLRIWREALARNYSRVVVLEDDVFFTPAALPRVPAILAAADAGAVAADRPWHMILFRRTALDATTGEEVWGEGDGGGGGGRRRRRRRRRRGAVAKPLGGPLTVSGPAWATAAYALSRAGMHYLLSHVTAYNVPLDVQVSRLHAPGTGFTSLAACNDLGVAGDCTGAVYELSRAEKGECSYSASQSGSRLDGGAFPNAGGRRSVAPL